MKLLLATRNRTKISLYSDILDGVAQVVSPADLNLFAPPVNETLNDAQKNAEMKAFAYSKLDPTVFVLGEDTSLEIPIIGNLPGPAVRRWGGEVSDNISDNDWVKLFRDKITPLAKKGHVECRKIHAYTLMRGKEKFNYTLTIPFNIILRDIPENIEYLDGPLSFFLFNVDLKKYENDFTKDEKYLLYKDVREFIISILKSRLI